MTRRGLMSRGWGLVVDSIDQCFQTLSEQQNNAGERRCGRQRLLLLAHCHSHWPAASKDRRAKRDRQAKKELLDLPELWDQKAIRVRQAQWGRPGRKETRGLKVKLGHPVPRAPQHSAS